MIVVDTNIVIAYFAEEARIVAKIGSVVTSGDLIYPLPNKLLRFVEKQN